MVEGTEECALSGSVGMPKAFSRVKVAIDGQREPGRVGVRGVDSGTPRIFGACTVCIHC